ncbi:helix-turn-helix domain-containing protein [Aliiroseovarius sp. PTFE2010]|uniref:helix-turn-helix domain-containing protein n=1 Tax=Aliiroseovarius sp. PTFE2010 TaxID=3417190 RepID=UPI003CEC949F
MSTVRHYKIAAVVRQTCNIMGISVPRVLARAALASDCLENEGKGVDAAAYFRLWTAFAEESGDPDLPLTLGRGASRGPFQPALLAFSSSPDIATGLRRLAVFKPLVAPINLDITQTDQHLNVRFSGADGQATPAVMAATEIIFFLDFARAFTAHHVLPHAITLPNLDWVTDAFRDYVGAPVTHGDHIALSFTMADAKRPLISADTEFYNLIEKELLARLSGHGDDAALSGRVRRVLADLLPSGQVSIDTVSARLNLSKRSLQRKLKDENTSFQALLDATRASLAMTYLRDQKLSAEETSFLLAYQDPNSFYRAFHEWTGMTPSQARVAEIN